MWEARAPSSSIGGRVPNPHGGHGFLRLFSNTALRREARNPDEFGESRAKELSVKRNSHPELRAPGSGPCTHDDHQRPGRLWEEHKGVSPAQGQISVAVLQGGPRRAGCQPSAFPSRYA